MRVRLQSALAVSAAIAAAALASATVVRADGMDRGPVASGPISWSGFYFGVQSGYEWDSTKWRPVNFPGINEDVDHGTGLVGAQIGYQHQFGPVVLGVEGHFASAFNDEPGDKLCSQVGCGADVHLTSQLDNILTIGGRAGWGIGRWMPYVSGGYASTSFTNQTRIETTTTSTLSETFRGGRDDGWYFGGGLDYKLSHHWIVGLEYRHYDLADRTLIPFAAGGTPVPNDVTRLREDLDTVMLRTSYQFSREGYAPLK